MLYPVQGLTPPIGTHIIGPAVAIDVHGEMRVVVVAPSDDTDVTQEMPFPGGCLVPPATTNDVQFPVPIDVDGSGCTIGRRGVDGVQAEANFARLGELWQKQQACHE